MSDVPERADQDNDLNEEVGPEVNIPGPYPTGQAPSSGDTDLVLHIRRSLSSLRKHETPHRWVT